jgi:hypothetical protein
MLEALGSILRPTRKTKQNKNPKAGGGSEVRKFELKE